MSNEKVLTIKETFDLAVQNHQKNNIKEAQNLYNKILEIDPNHSQTLNNIAIIFTNLKDYQKAKDCYEKVITINPNYINAHTNLGLVYGTIGNHKKAVYHNHKIFVSRVLKVLFQNNALKLIIPLDIDLLNSLK